MKAIEVEGLVKKFGDFEAVRGISFEVEKGEIFAFLGPNGAGKSTTVHILTTILKPTGGRAFVSGFDVLRNASEVRKRIGVVFQDPSVDRELTGYENMYIHGRIYGLKPMELREKIEKLLKFVELWDFRDKAVKNYSGGMQRRLEIARALLHEPEVLFLDEPTTGLDPQTRAKIWDYIQSIKEEKGMTIFLTTHYMEEAENLADRVAIMDHGRIIAEGTPESLKKLVGKDLIYLRLENPEKAEVLFEGLSENYSLLLDGRIKIEVSNASEELPKIFDLARERNVRITEVSYHRPTLNDVFLHLTGREIRESGGNNLSLMVMRRRRMRR
ncbi:MAG: type transport system ATP-binding protein [Archaeoglobi archaeon]|nr:type transport system ATP-binding protein [Archaeoglobi archaeon]